MKLSKKAQIISNKNDIINLINENLNNNDYLMIKGSISTGLHKITKDLKVKTSNVIWTFLNYIDTFTFLNVFKYILLDWLFLHPYLLLLLLADRL